MWVFLFFIVQTQAFSGFFFGFFLTCQKVKFLTYQNFADVKFADVSFRENENFTDVRFLDFYNAERGCRFLRPGIVLTTTTWVPRASETFG